MSRDLPQESIASMQVIKPSISIRLFFGAAPAFIFLVGFVQWAGFRSGLPRDGLVMMLLSLPLGAWILWLGANQRIYLGERSVLFRKRQWLPRNEMWIAFSTMKQAVRVEKWRAYEGPWDRLEVTFDDAGTDRTVVISLAQYSRGDVNRILDHFAKGRTTSSALEHRVMLQGS